jgi:hypothetical protein
MKLIDVFTIPATNGDAERLFTAFKGKDFQIDPGCMVDVIVGSGTETIPWAAAELRCQLFDAGVGVSDDSLIKESLGLSDFNRDNVCSALVLLATTEEGKSALAIPEGQHEVNVILGYTKTSVFFLEHELEPGKEEEFHLHVRPRKAAWKRAPRLLLIS